MSTQPVTSGAPRNNGATVLGGGAADVTPVLGQVHAVTNVPGKEILGAGRKPQPGPVEAAPWNQKAVSAGLWAYLSPDNWVIRRVGEVLAGTVATRVLKSGGSDFGQRRSIHFLNTRWTVHILSWDYATGVPTFAAPKETNDDFGDDNAAGPAIPTRAIPGQLVELWTGKLPESLEYDAKTG